MRQIRLGIVSRTFYYVPVWGALRHGRFKDIGIDIDLQLIGHADQAQLLRDRNCDIVIAPPDGILQDVDRGGRAIVLAGNSDRLSHCLITQPDIKSVEALKGRRVGVLSRTEGSYFHFEQLALAHGMRFPDDFEIVETGGAPLRHQLLLEKKIDAGLQSFPWAYIEEDAGFNNLLDISDFVPEWQFNTINSERDWLDANGPLASDFLAVLADATDWFYQNPEGAAAVAVAEMNVPHELALRAWGYFNRGHCLTRDLSVSEPGLAIVYEALRRSGLVAPDGPFMVEKYVAGVTSVRRTARP